MKFTMIELNKIHNMDCFEGMKQIDDKSVDLVLTDPPYNIKWKQQIEIHGRKTMYHNFDELAGEEGWDNVDIKDLYERLFPELDRVVKDNGSVIIFVRNEWITYAIDAGKKNNFDVKSTIIWHKTNPIPQIRKKNYLSSTEAIVWLARWNEDKCNFKFNFQTQNEMHNFIEMPLCGGDERTAHPTQKPIELIKRFLKIHSDEGDLVFDPFMGSGTTAVACKILNRRFIGFEVNPEYKAIADKRLDSVNNERLTKWFE